MLAMEDEKDKKDYLLFLYGELYIKDIVERNGNIRTKAGSAWGGWKDGMVESPLKPESGLSLSHAQGTVCAVSRKTGQGRRSG